MTPNPCGGCMHAWAHATTIMHVRIATREKSIHLSVSPEGQSVVPLPSCLARRTILGVRQTTGMLSSRCEAAHFAVLVDRVDDPVYAGVVADSIVVRVN
mmetsp:Transcript_20501/g.33666  ORF Transcript_20501/g.33666 Transcript_20501/m.33666 type:complete len:99 (-) Transcript_20501:420-716(-)